MADTFQTGGSHPPGKNTDSADGTIVSVSLQDASLSGRKANDLPTEPYFATLCNNSPLNSERDNTSREK